MMSPRIATAWVTGVPGLRARHPRQVDLQRLSSFAAPDNEPVDHMWWCRAGDLDGFVVEYGRLPRHAPGEGVLRKWFDDQVAAGQCGLLTGDQRLWLDGRTQEHAGVAH